MTIKTVFVAVSVLALAACGGEAEAPSEPVTELAPAPEGPEGISAEGGWMALPAVSGNPAAVYFTLTNNGGAEEVVSAAWVTGAESAMLHGEGMVMLDELAVGPGTQVIAAPGGLHIMAMNLNDSLVEGGETELTLTFADGDKLSFPVEIRAAGDAPADGAGE